MIRLWFARHGQTPWNRAGRYQGQRDIPLNSTGRAQARQLAARLTDEPITAAYTSDLARCLQTAHMIGKAPLTADPRLREPDYGAFTGLTYDEMRKLAPAIYPRWQADRAVPPPQGERVTAVIERTRAFLADVQRQHPLSTVLVVTHGETLALLLCDLLQAPLSSWRDYTTDNASLTRLHLSTNDVTLHTFNNTEHLLP